MADQHRRTVSALALGLGLVVPGFVREATAQPQTGIFGAELTTDRVQTTLLEVRLAETEPARGLLEAPVQGSPSQVWD